MGSQRITTKLQGDNIFTNNNPIVTGSEMLATLQDVSYTGTIDFAAKKDTLTAKLVERHELIGTPYLGRDNNNQGFTGSTISTQSYYYHPDHLGSSSQITDGTGKLVQHLEYLPLREPQRIAFGEVFLDRRSTLEDWNTLYKFSGKELGPATGLYYFGVRYYYPRTSVWLEVDPLADKYPEKTPYHYCSNNPVMKIDPDGRDEYELNKKGNIVNQIENKSEDSFHMVDKNGDRLNG